MNFLSLNIMSIKCFGKFRALPRALYIFFFSLFLWCPLTYYICFEGETHRACYWCSALWSLLEVFRGPHLYSAGLALYKAWPLTPVVFLQPTLLLLRHSLWIISSIFSRLFFSAFPLEIPHGISSSTHILSVFYIYYINLFCYFISVFSPYFYSFNI